MEFKKLTSLLICMVMLLTVLSGCNKTVDEVINDYSETEETGETGDTDTEDTAESETASRDYEAARAMYPADELVMTIKDEQINWDEFFNWICYAITNYEYSFGPISDFDADGTLGGSIKDTILDDAKYYATLYRTVDQHAKDLGIDYPADIDETVQSDLDSALEYYEGDQAKLAEYITATFGNRENYEYVLKIDSLYDPIFNELYGENGADLTEEQLAEGSEGFMMAKHILVQTTGEDGAALSEEEQEAARQKIEDIKAQLDEYDGDDLEGFFTQLMNENSEDDGKENYPDGYLFSEGDMVTEFYEAALNLEEGQVSDIVESGYGYHIIMRLPVDFDATPMSYARYGYTYSLRYVIASQLFRDQFQTWVDEMGAETAPFYDTIDLTKLFPAAETEEPASETPAE